MTTFFILVVVACSQLTFIISIEFTTRAGNYAVPLGFTVNMKCIPPEVFIDESQIYNGKSFIWTDEDGKELLNPRIETLPSGDLQIVRVHETDSGIYHCKFKPSQAFKHDGVANKLFKHKLIVYELSGHKFETLVPFDVTQHGSEVVITLLRDLMKQKICKPQLCIPGPITTNKCEISETERQMCEISMIYDGVPVQATDKCNELCVREIVVQKLKTAEKLLESAMLLQLNNPESHMKPEMSSFDTKHTIVCKAGYHLIESNYNHCFPCQPGTYSEPGNLKCKLCPIGFYQEKYGSRGCEQCLDDKTTETAGSNSRDNCRSIADTGILKDIKDGFASIFKG